MAFSNFRGLRKFLATRWQVADEGGLVGYAIDLMRDAQMQRLYLGHLARFPEAAPPDALAAHGRQRRVIRGINESQASYVDRLIRYLDDRKQQGSPFALLKKLAEYTGPGPAFRTVDARGNWFSRAADGTETYLLKRENWNWDDRPIDLDTGKVRWSRFWVIIYPNGLWTEGAGWGDPDAPAWGENNVTWGSTATPEQVASIRSIVAQWKGLHARCINIILAFDPASFDPLAGVGDSGMPAGLWEHWSRNVGGVQVPARLDTARYWDGMK